jgi:hypothetical protein
VHSAFVLATRFRGRARGYNDMVVMGSLQLPEMLDTTPGKQETEMKMLESSLIRQATIALEEAKLQLATLRAGTHIRTTYRRIQEIII